MIEYDVDLIAKAVAGRASEQKWRTEMTNVVSAICNWYAANPGVAVEYRNGQPNDGMIDMLAAVSAETGNDRRAVLSSYGAAHSLLCDVVPGFRPALFSAWDRKTESKDRH